MDDSEEPLSLVLPLPPHNGTCGYCSPPGERSTRPTNYHAAECVAQQLSCRAYQAMIDRGWRRSGTYCYKPDLKRSCCPQYTIKLDALAFKPSKSQRKLINRWNRFVIYGDQREDGVMAAADKHNFGQLANSTSMKAKAKRQPDHAFDLTEDIHASEASFLEGKEAVHKFEVTLEPSSFTEEKFALYCAYQKEIHNDDDNSASGFKRFLIENPLVLQPIKYESERPHHLPADYGAYHQLYRLDGELIAMGVIDILPNCVSSVYFMYNKKWEKHSLGKLSAMREITLAREIHEAGVPEMKELYMGFYIHSCVKMRYKGEYSPSYLADPEEYTWHPLEKCRPLLDKNHYASFAHPDHCLTKPATTPGSFSALRMFEHGAYTDTDPAVDYSKELSQIKAVDVVRGHQVVLAPVNTTSEWKRSTRAAKEAMFRTVGALGLELSRELVFDLGHLS